MHPPQWIVTDLDETLLDSNRAISKRAMIAIRQVRENGIKFAIATTRSKQFAQKYIDQLQPDAMVLSGGALGYISDELRYQKTIEQMHVHQLLGIFSESASVSNIILDTSDGRVDWTARTDEPIPTQVNSIFFWTSEWHAKHIAEQWKHSCTVTALWEPDMYRISHKHATKHSALQALFSDTDPARIVCFGDDLMDVGMLSYFSGVAVSNGKQEAKDAATYLTKSHLEDGVAHWIEQHLLS
jgi:hypothetical protein